jgi:hypothetical protein
MDTHGALNALLSAERAHLVVYFSFFTLYLQDWITGTQILGGLLKEESRD